MEIISLIGESLGIQQHNYNTTATQHNYNVMKEYPNWLGYQKPYNCLSVTPPWSIILYLQHLPFLRYTDLTLRGLTHIYPCAGLNNPKEKKKLNQGFIIQFERGTVLLADQHLLSNDSKLGTTTDTLAKLQSKLFHLWVPLLPAHTRINAIICSPLTVEVGNVWRPAALSCYVLMFTTMTLKSQQEAPSAM